MPNEYLQFLEDFERGPGGGFAVFRPKRRKRFPSFSVSHGGRGVSEGAVPFTPPFTPLDVPEVHVWLSAQREAQRRELDTSSTAILAQWDDETDGDRHATQATEARRPLLKFDGGRWVGHTDGVDDFMDILGVSSLAQPNVQAYGIIFRNFPAGTGSGAARAWTDGRNTSTRHTTGRSSGTPAGAWRMFAGSNTLTSIGVTITSDTPYVFWDRYSGATSESRLNGVLRIDPGDAGAQPYSPRIFADAAGGSNIEADWTDYILFDGIPSDAHRAQIEAFLAGNVGVTL